MSRGLRLMGAAVLACASVPLFGVTPAHADTASLTASNGAYFYAAGVDKPDQSPASIPNLGALTDGVSPGNLPVAAKNGTEDKVSFLYYDVFDVPAEAIVDKAVVSLTLVPNSKDDISYQAAPEKVVACMAGDQGFNGDDGVGIANAPSRLCDKFKAVGKLSADTKSYEFDITGLVGTWLTDANEGVAFTVADKATSSNFQVVFGKADTAVLAVTYSLPVDTTTPPVTTPIDNGVGTITPPDSGGGFAPTPQTGGFAPAPDVVAPVAPNPTVNQPPVAVAPQQQPATNNVAAVIPSMRPTSAFWLTGLGLLVALALLSLVFGDTRVPAVSQSRSRLTKALSSRQGTSGARVGFRPLPI